MRVRPTVGSSLVSSRSCDPGAGLWPTDEEGDELAHRDWGAATVPDTNDEQGARVGGEDPSEASGEVLHGELQPLMDEAGERDLAVATEGRHKSVTYRAAPTGGDTGARANRERVRADVLGAWHRREVLGLAIAAGWVSVAEREQSVTRKAIRSRPGVRGLAAKGPSKGAPVAMQLPKSSSGAYAPDMAKPRLQQPAPLPAPLALPAPLGHPDSTAAPPEPVAPASPEGPTPLRSGDAVRVVKSTWREAAVVTAAAARLGSASARKSASGPNVGAGVAAGLTSLVVPLAAMGVPLSAGAVALSAASAAVAGATCPASAVGMAAWGVAYGVVGLVLAISRAVWLGHAAATGSMESMRALGAVSLGSHVVRACLSVWGLVVAVSTAALLAVAPWLGVVGSAGLAACGGAWPLAVLVVCAVVFGAAHVAAAVAAVSEAVAGPSVREDSETKFALHKLEAALQGRQSREAPSEEAQGSVGSDAETASGAGPSSTASGAASGGAGTVSKRAAGGPTPVRGEVIP